MKNLQIAAVVLMTITTTIGTFAQDKKPRISPPDTVSGMIGKAHISIAYSKPSVKGREIWGALVPYDAVWRAGANEATTFETDKDIRVQGQLLPAGQYSFFVIPVKDKPWTVIFNKTAKQWGAFKYNQEEDQLRVMVTPKSLPESMPVEVLTYHLTKKGFSLDWEKLSIPVVIKAAK